MQNGPSNLDPAYTKAGPQWPIWPYIFLGLIAGVFGAVLVVVNWPTGFPAEDDLVKLSGKITRTVVRDDISNSSAGAILPSLTSVYFTLKGVDAELRYPSINPQYPKVRDYTAFAMDAWVERAELNSGGPLRIWQIIERSPYNLVVEATDVRYDEIVAHVTRVERSMVQLGSWLLAAAAALLALSYAVRRRNRGHPPAT